MAAMQRYLIVFVFIALYAVAVYSDGRPKIEASDVVFMYSAEDPVQYELYDGTVVGWGGRPSSRDDKALDGFRKRVAAAHSRGLKYCASVDFLVDFGGFIKFKPESFMDSVCVDLEGNPLRVPWLWDHTFNGHPAYWFCSNDPQVQAYYKDQAERAGLAPIDGLHIDDYSGSSACSAYNGGCFCGDCVTGFRAYLQKKYSVNELETMGISSIEDFDYGKYLKDKGVTVESYRTKHHEVPLIEVFQTYQNRQMKELIEDVYTHAEDRCGKALLRSINSNASSPRTLVPAPVIDYFCGEVHHDADSMKGPAEPVFVFKVVEALGRRQTATASGQDWAWIKAHEKPGLVRMWIAQAYAFGSVFMVPHRQWCYTQELGTHWWHGKPEDFTYLYRFAREHEQMLNGYKSFADTALVYSSKNYGTIHRAAREMAVANIPFSVVIAGDEEIPMNFGPTDFESYRHIIVGGNDDPNQKDIEKNHPGESLVWNGMESLPKPLREQVIVKGSDQVRISLRYDPEFSQMPVICHVLNQAYSESKDDVEPVSVEISFDLGVFQEHPYHKRAMVYAPNREAKGVNVTVENGRLSIPLENLPLWSIVRF